MRKLLLILIFIGLRTDCHGFNGDGGPLWNPFPENERRHTSLEIHNSNAEQIRLNYCKKNAGFAAILRRRRILQPGKKAQITLLKNRSLKYQSQVACPEDCDQIGKHDHWGENVKVAFEDEKSIVLGAITKLAAKR